METNAAETNENAVILTIAEATPMGIVLTRLLEKAKAQANDKGNYSVEYFAEDMLSRGCESFNNYLDADKKRRSEKLFTEQLSKLKVPAPDDQAGMLLYASQVSKLQAKHGLGGQEQAL